MGGKITEGMQTTEQATSLNPYYWIEHHLNSTSQMKSKLEY
jgi:hypothetical protein